MRLGIAVASEEEPSRGFSRPFVLGRSEGCDVRVCDLTVSRHHLDVFPLLGKWYALDRSSNGTFFGHGWQERFGAGPVELSDGMTLCVGRVPCRVVLKED